MPETSFAVLDNEVRASTGNGSKKGAKRADAERFHDGVPLVEAEWDRYRAAAAHRYVRSLDRIRVEMTAMYKAAQVHEARPPPIVMLEFRRQACAHAMHRYTHIHSIQSITLP
jgi:hypothetical protein